MNHDFGADFHLTLLTADPDTAAEADAAGVQRIGVDLELRGKAERQTSLENRISRHTVQDLQLIGDTVQSAELFVRINPLHAGTAEDIDLVLNAGARWVMLPFFREVSDVEQFVRLLGGRARAAILIETSAALLRIRRILAVRGIDEVTFGFNDLRHDFRVRSHFEVLGSPLIDSAAREVVRRGLPLSMGGVGRPDDGDAPMPVELVYAQYPRLWATGAWIARSFLRQTPKRGGLADDVQRLRQRLTWRARQSAEDLERAREELLLRAEML
jgi:HpcH/HpaI aldolase/citrate lyase family